MNKYESVIIIKPTLTEDEIKNTINKYKEKFENAGIEYNKDLYNKYKSFTKDEILSLKKEEYVLASKSFGAKSGWIIKKHLLPNSISVILISTALQIPSAIFTESYLSFLGLGVNAPMPSLGSLASEALNGITSYPIRLIIPAIFISVIVLTLNLVGDGLRDAFDPKLS